MLPLWIIDLRAKSPQRDSFESLVGEIKNVYIKKNDDSEKSKTREPSNGASNISEYGDYRMSSDSVQQIESNISFNEKQKLESKDKEEAERKSIIEGYYWRYSRMKDFVIGADLKLKEVEVETDAGSTAERLYVFQNLLVSEGQAFIKQLRASNASPDIKINIVVLGDITEELTRIVFPAIAGILQKEKGRILPHHIHQGMEIIGMLYIPSDINTRDANVRRSMQRTLVEIDVQHCINDIRGYDHVMFYQDVQNRTECYYSILNDEQLAEYLIQCLVHLYLACNDSHPLLSGTSSADIFYFSMGATSVFYNAENEDIKARKQFTTEFVRNFKSQGEDTKKKQKLSIFSDKDYNPKSFFDYDALSKLPNDDIGESRPSVHPVRNFMAKYLKRNYYGSYLRFFTQKFLQRIINQIEESTHDALGVIASNVKGRYSDAQKHIKRSIDDILYKLSANDGGIPAIEQTFKDMQEGLSRKKQAIKSTLKDEFWVKIESHYISKSLIDKFTEYHDAYERDIDSKTGGTDQLDMKKEAVNNLNNILGSEATTLSRVGRSVLMGIMCALAIVPILNILSPHVIDFGHVRRNGEWWSLGMFCLPFLFQLFSFWRYNRKKKRAVNNLRAMYLHDAYARVANRVESEINAFYDKLIALGEKYIARCECIRKEIGINMIEEEQQMPLFKQSMFNQPLIGGKFGNDTLLPDKETANMEVRINHFRHKFKDLTKIDYFLFINQNKNIIKELFDDVRLCENLIRRIKDHGEEELLTKEQQEAELLSIWEKRRENFHKALHETVKNTIVKRDDDTIGDKLHRFYNENSDNVNILKPMINFAASNGEVTSSADMEYTDAKLNDRSVEDYIMPFISSTCVQMQSDKYNKIYSKYIFITRWRCFDHFNLNRVLPSEDFDKDIRDQLVTKEEIGIRQYKRQVSSLLLWSLCPDDSSSEWFRLFDSEFFAEAYEDKNIYRRILNQND